MYLTLWTRRGHGFSACCECCVLSGRGPCVGLTTRSEEPYRKWGARVWSWSLEILENLAHYWLLRHKKNELWCYHRIHIACTLKYWSIKGSFVNHQNIFWGKIPIRWLLRQNNCPMNSQLKLKTASNLETSCKMHDNYVRKTSDPTALFYCGMYSVKSLQFRTKGTTLRYYIIL
jgi:hypothetical protein